MILSKDVRHLKSTNNRFKCGKNSSSSNRDIINIENTDKNAHNNHYADKNSKTNILLKKKNWFSLV